MKDEKAYAVKRLLELKKKGRNIRCEICARPIEVWGEFQYVQCGKGYEHWYCNECLISSDHKERRAERDRNNTEGNCV